MVYQHFRSSFLPFPLKINSFLLLLFCFLINLIGNYRYNTYSLVLLQAFFALPLFFIYRVWSPHNFPLTFFYINLASMSSIYPTHTPYPSNYSFPHFFLKYTYLIMSLLVAHKTAPLSHTPS